MTDSRPTSGHPSESRLDVALLRRLARHDVAAIADLYDRYGRAVFSLALHMLEDGAEAEAIAYEILASAVEQAVRLDLQRIDLGTWLLLAARRRALERRRARDVAARTDEQAVGELPEPSTTHDGMLLPPDALARLRTALAARPLLERLPIELAYFRGLTHTAIAQHLDTRPELVRARIRQGLAALRGAGDQPGGHEEALELATLYALGAVSASERRAVQDHLDICLRCVQEVRGLLPIVYGLTRAVPLVEPPDSLRERLTLRSAERSVAPSGPFVERPRHPEEAEVAVAPQEAEPRRPAAIAAWAVALLAVTVAAAAGWYAVDTRDELAAARSRTEELAHRAALAEGQVTALTRTASETQAALAVLGAPDLASVDLHGQPAAPQASGRLFWSRTRGLFFTAANLPPAPPDRAYQIWFVPSSSQAIPARVGHVRPDGAGRVSASLATPPDLPTPMLVFVTLEPTAGVTSPTGERYLASAPPPGPGVRR